MTSSAFPLTPSPWYPSPTTPVPPSFPTPSPTIMVKIPFSFLFLLLLCLAMCGAETLLPFTTTTLADSNSNTITESGTDSLNLTEEDYSVNEESLLTEEPENLKSVADLPTLQQNSDVYSEQHESKVAVSHQNISNYVSTSTSTTITFSMSDAENPSASSFASPSAYKASTSITTPFSVAPSTESKVLPDKKMTDESEFLSPSNTQESLNKSSPQNNIAFTDWASLRPTFDEIVKNVSFLLLNSKESDTNLSLRSDEISTAFSLSPQSVTDTFRKIDAEEENKFTNSESIAIPEAFGDVTDILSYDVHDEVHAHETPSVSGVVTEKPPDPPPPPSPLLGPSRDYGYNLDRDHLTDPSTPEQEEEEEEEEEDEEYHLDLGRREYIDPRENSPNNRNYYYEYYNYHARDVDSPALYEVDNDYDSRQYEGDLQSCDLDGCLCMVAEEDEMTEDEGKGGMIEEGNREDKWNQMGSIDGDPPPPGYRVLCNASITVRNLSSIVQHGCKIRVTTILVTQQMELCQITTYDFQGFHHVTHLSITDSALQQVDDGAFGNLTRLLVLDLRRNHLLALPWRTLWPGSIRGERLHHLRTAGNVLLNLDDCRNAWLLPWRKEEEEEKEEDDEERNEEGENEENGDRESETFIELKSLDNIESAKHPKWKGYNENEEEKNGLANDQTEKEEMKKNTKQQHKSRKVWRESKPDEDVFANSTRNSTSEECSFPGAHGDSRCYLCPPTLTLLQEKGTGACRSVIVTCSASGLPPPKIQWDIPDHLLLVSEETSMESGDVGDVGGDGDDGGDTSCVSVTSTLNLTFNMSLRLVSHGVSNVTTTSVHYRPLVCIAQNDRSFSVEEMNITMDALIYRKPQVCWTAYSAISTPEKFKFIAQALPPWHLEWWYYPCENIYAGENYEGTDLKYYHAEDMYTSYIEGELHFRNQVAKRGHYEFRVYNKFGDDASSIFMSRRPPPDEPCEKKQFISITPTMIPKPSQHPQLPSSAPPSAAIIQCPLTPTHITTTAVLVDSPPHSTDGEDPKAIYSLPIEVLLTIAACGVVVVIGLTLLLLRNIRWTRGRTNMEIETCPDSPFQITFLGCLCRGEECQKKTEMLHTHEMMPISAERLVENPEYIGNGLVTPSKPQVRVLPRDKLKLVSELGEGAFGRVYLGIMEDSWGRSTQVAVKTLKSVGPEARQELEREVELLNNLVHKNIVSFYGVSYSSDSLFMVFEYMEHGDLNNYLRNHNEDVALLSGEETSSLEPLSVMDCLQVALQVAAGMKYLASQHYVHRDLATRNCLVGANLVVKIGDFGMSRDVYTTDYYQFGGQALLPVRWMPPESILYRRFTIESDIWSFGVVLWEIFSGGKQPWYGYTNQEVITQITASKILNCPEKCPPDMYRIMLTCWTKNPQERPNMATLFERIRALTTVEPHVLDYDYDTCLQPCA